MIHTLTNFFKKKHSPKGGPILPEQRSTTPHLARDLDHRGPTFSKVFRWRLPDGQLSPPATVEVVGSFTHWQKLQLTRDSVLDAWHVTLHHLQGNRTHHYMILVDGQPVCDKTCDGLAVPRGAEEERFAFLTDKGPRVFMLFAQTK